MNRFLSFIAVVVGWAVAGRIVLELGILPPVALFILWLIGFVWLVGRVVGSSTEANHLLKTTGLMFGLIAALAGVIFLLQVS